MRTRMVTGSVHLANKGVGAGGGVWVQCAGIGAAGTAGRGGGWHGTPAARGWAVDGGQGRVVMWPTHPGMCAMWGAG